jgi:quinoprotein glucose dehydrogenase
MVAPGPQGMPLTKPPYAVVVGIDLNKGEIAWKVPHGDGPRHHPALGGKDPGPLGATSHGFLSSGGPLVTKTLLFVNQAQLDMATLRTSETELFLRAFDKANGDVVWEERMELPPYGTPMTYMHEGKQYVVVACGGSGKPARLVAYALP